MPVISFIIIRITDERGDGPIIYTVPIGTMINFNDGSNGHSLKTLHVNRPSTDQVHQLLALYYLYPPLALYYFYQPLALYYFCQPLALYYFCQPVALYYFYQPLALYYFNQSLSLYFLLS